MKSKKPKLTKLIAPLVQMLVGGAAIVVFIILTVKGIPVGKWAITLILALVYFVMGIFGVYSFIKERLKQEIDENWFTPFKY